MIRKSLALALSYTLVLSGCSSAPSSTPPGNGAATSTPPVTITPTTAPSAIKHVVVIFGENVSFDHYFGTYPNATNPGGQPQFTAAAGTPVPENYISNPTLLTANPNSTSAGNGAGKTNPFRLDRSQASTADQSHSYTPEQMAFDGGKMDLFPASVGSADTAALAKATGAPAIAATTGLTMGYYDGNTVTGLWNYAQHYALNDHSFDTNFGPSTPGAINVISGQTNGVINITNSSPSDFVADGNGGVTLIGDSEPLNDACSKTASANAQMSGTNIGDLLNAKGLTWGWFQGGFNLSITNPNGTTGCSRSSVSSVVGTQADYVEHHQPFQYYKSTANPNHTRPSAAIGASDQANHQYDTQDFTTALAAGTLPAVSFLKAPSIGDAHPGNSDPLDEQAFIINTVNAIEQSSFWPSTAIILAYDDSDGWYDHVSNLVNGSATVSDVINGTGVCISTTAAAAALPGVTGTAPAQGRCGYGPRLPLMVISPWAKKNYISKVVTDQSSVTKFIEDVFLGGQRIGGGSFDSIAGSLTDMFDFSNGATPPNPNIVLLDPATGLVTSKN